MLTNIHTFFTFWVAVLLLFHRHTHRYIDLLLLTFVTMFCGLYLSLISPRKYSFVLFDQTYVLSGIDRFFVVDIVFHIIAFVLVYSAYGRCYSPTSLDNRFMLALLMIAVYPLCVNGETVYMSSKRELCAVMVLGVLAYTLLFNKK